MSDIIERLRPCGQVIMVSPEFCNEVIDEIERLRTELAEAQAVIEQMHKFAFDRHDAMLDQIVDNIMKGDTALKGRLVQERERCAVLCEQSDRYRGEYFAALIRKQPC